MSDLVTSEAVLDLVLEVARDQVGRGKNFHDILTKALGVQAEYQVSQTLKLTERAQLIFSFVLFVMNSNMLCFFRIGCKANRLVLTHLLKKRYFSRNITWPPLYIHRSSL